MRFLVYLTLCAVGSSLLVVAFPKLSIRQHTCLVTGVALLALGVKIA